MPVDGTPAVPSGDAAAPSPRAGSRPKRTRSGKKATVGVEPAAGSASVAASAGPGRDGAGRDPVDPVVDLRDQPAGGEGRAGTTPGPVIVPARSGPSIEPTGPFDDRLASLTGGGPILSNDEDDEDGHDDEDGRDRGGGEAEKPIDRTNLPPVGDGGGQSGDRRSEIDHAGR